MMTFAERHPGRTFAIIGVIFALGYLVGFATSGRSRVINGDAIQYYAYLRSAVFDGDLDFSNEYARFYGTDTEAGGDSVWLHGRTPIGRSPNLMSVGPAILWSPFYLAMLVAASAAAAVGVPIAIDGFSAPFQLIVGLAGIAYATCGMYLCYRTAALRFSTRVAVWSALVAWLASPAIYYTLVSPTYSHAVSIFTVALFVFTWLRSIGEMSARRFVVLGVLGGLAALVRWQDLVIVFLCPLCEVVLALRRRSASARSIVARLVLMGITAGVVASPQLLAWRAVYGQYLVIPQGTGFMRWTEPALLSVLFSTRHGLFLWTPALLVAVAGLAWLFRRDVVLGSAAILAVCASIYVNAAVSDWWAGEAFGARRFVSDAVFFTCGLAALGAWLGARFRPSLLRAASVALIAYNVLFLVQYQLFMRGYRDLAPYPSTVKAVLIDRLTVPFHFLWTWISG